MKMFNIVSINRTCPDTVTVKVTMNSKAWFKAVEKDEGNELYDRILAPAIASECSISAQAPCVDDSFMPKGGVKLLEITFIDSAWVEIDNVIKVDFVNRRRAA